jgi:hypothetical protein
MYTFVYLDKSQKNEILPVLFDILYANMSIIAPSDLPYETERSEFLTEVSSGLEKEPRKIILCYCKGEIVGFLMYYTREALLMIEEVQLKKEHQKTMLFFRLCCFLAEKLPTSIELLESFVHKQNISSLSLQTKLGMKIIDTPNQKLYHLRGDAKSIYKRFNK